MPRSANPFLGNSLLWIIGLFCCLYIDPWCITKLATCKLLVINIAAATRARIFNTSCHCMWLVSYSPATTGRSSIEANPTCRQQPSVSTWRQQSWTPPWVQPSTCCCAVLFTSQTTYAYNSKEKLCHLFNLHRSTLLKAPILSLREWLSLSTMTYTSDLQQR